MAGLLSDEELIDKLYGPDADTVEADVYRRFGLTPNLKRGTVLPIARDEQGNLTPAVPQAVIDFLKAVSLPVHVARGGQYTPSDVTEMAANVGLLGSVATKPAGALASGLARQSITSADTSIPQVAGLLKAVPFKPGTVNLDYGGGKFDIGSEYLKSLGVNSKVYDPFNRPAEHNAAVLSSLKETPADTATIANVLNVIPEKEARIAAIKDAGQYVKNDGVLHFSVYEGNKSGVGTPTTKGWQANRATEDYLDEIRSVYPNAYRKGKIIYAPKSNSKVTK